jgi:hypothetical protein
MKILEQNQFSRSHAGGRVLSANGIIEYRWVVGIFNIRSMFFRRSICMLLHIVLRRIRDPEGILCKTDRQNKKLNGS